jgi:hypothetical protein
MLKEKHMRHKRNGLSIAAALFRYAWALRDLLLGVLK